MKLVIAGAGGFGREVLQHALDAQAAGAECEVVGFLDDRQEALAGFDLPVSIVGGLGSERWLVGNVVIALGDPVLRAQFRSRVEAVGGALVTIAHPSAYVASSASIGDGTVVGPGVYVGIGSEIGANVVLNTYSSVGHDAKIGPDSVLSSYTAVTGSCTLGQGVFTGTHSTITPGVSVGAWSKVAAGSVATRDSPTGSLLVGNPAKGRVMFSPPTR